MKVEVYRNLRYRNKVVYSVRSARTKLVMFHAMTIYLSDVTFKVSAKGNARVRREKVKNVHAFVCGTIRKTPKRGAVLVKASYNPYKRKTFVIFNDTPIRATTFAQLDKDGCWARLHESI